MLMASSQLQLSYQGGIVAVTLRVPSEVVHSETNDYFLSYERTTAALCLRYGCRTALMTRTSPEATNQAHLLFVNINSAKIQQGCSTLTDGSNHP